ncbi:MAG: OmpA family protein [Salinivirgaceae bacterium]
MKILLIGLIAFLSWSALSNYVYVCKIKELCNENEIVQKDSKHADSMADEALKNTRVATEQAIPESLVVYFAFDKSDIHANDITAEYFNASNTYLNQNALAIMQITGHADAVGTFDYNKALGLRRAQSLKRFFEMKGVPADRMLISSKGESMPSENNRTKEGRAKNRRAVITLKK